MKITPLRTEKVLPGKGELLSFLEKHLPQVPERSVIVISSKIVSLFQDNTLPLSCDKEALMRAEADYYLPKRFRKHGSCTIVQNAFIGAAGIDESNAAGRYVLLPRDPFGACRDIYRFLRERYGLQEFGVILSDSHSTPFRRGASGISIAWHGFRPLRDYRGTPDVFGRNLVMEQANLVDPLAAAAVFSMGEGNEQMPLALIEDLPELAFHEDAPLPEEVSEFLVDIRDDIFFPIINFRRFLSRKRKPG